VKTVIANLLAPLARLGIAAEPLRRAWAFAQLSARIRGKLDRSVVVLGCPEVHGTGNIALGRNLYLYRELHLETQEAGAIEIGNDVVISRGTHIVAHSRISIGDDSMIGEYVSIRDANHNFGHGKSIRYSGHTACPISIGKNVWIGRGVTVLAGVQIGDGAVVGANAVVTHNVREGEVVAGVPARPLYAQVSR
jgi:acetyltransferase-like isoleucine patch superfamily enzyme